MSPTRSSATERTNSRTNNLCKRQTTLSTRERIKGYHKSTKMIAIVMKNVVNKTKRNKTKDETVKHSSECQDHN